MNITKLVLGACITNCYIVASEQKNCVIIDPADEAEKIISAVEEQGLTVKYIFITYGHTDGSMAIVLEDIIFTGDTLLKENHGKTMLPGGDEDKLIESINRLVRDFQGEYRILTGHRAETTLQYEREHNPYIV